MHNVSSIYIILRFCISCDGRKEPLVIFGSWIWLELWRSILLTAKHVLHQMNPGTAFYARKASTFYRPQGYAIHIFRGYIWGRTIRAPEYTECPRTTRTAGIFLDLLACLSIPVSVDQVIAPCSQAITTVHGCLKTIQIASCFSISTLMNYDKTW